MRPLMEAGATIGKKKIKDKNRKIGGPSPVGSGATSTSAASLTGTKLLTTPKKASGKPPGIPDTSAPSSATKKPRTQRLNKPNKKNNALTPNSGPPGKKYSLAGHGPYSFLLFSCPVSLYSITNLSPLFGLFEV